MRRIIREPPMWISSARMCTLTPWSSTTTTSSRDEQADLLFRVRSVRAGQPRPAERYIRYALLAEKIRTTYPEVVGWLSWHDWTLKDGSWVYKSIAKNDASPRLRSSVVLNAHDLPTSSRTASLH